VSCLLLLVVSLITYRIVEKFFLGGGAGVATRPTVEALRSRSETSNRPTFVLRRPAPDDTRALLPALVAVKGGTV
jgi:hypothetical protein